MLIDTRPHTGETKSGLVDQVIRSQARIGCSLRPMTVSEGKTIVLRVSVKSRLFLVGPALLAISVSGRAERREGAGLEGAGLFFSATCLR